MRFSQSLAQQEELVPRQLPQMAHYQGIPLIAGQVNYVLESISGFNTAAATVQGFLGPVTLPQLEHLRDRLMQMFPVGGGGAGGGVSDWASNRPEGVSDWASNRPEGG
jgi:hypothetical protein